MPDNKTAEHVRDKWITVNGQKYKLDLSKDEKDPSGRTVDVLFDDVRQALEGKASARVFVLDEERIPLELVLNGANLDVVILDKGLKPKPSEIGR